MNKEAIDKHMETATLEFIEAVAAGKAPFQQPLAPGEFGAEVGLRSVNETTDEYLMDIEEMRLQMKGHKDPRWMTAEQGETLGAQLKPDENGQTVAVVRVSDGFEPVLTTLYNAEQFEGLGQFQPNRPDWSPAETIQELAERTEVTIHHDQKDGAFYDRKRHEIHLPPAENFRDPVTYSTVLTVQMAHAAGSSNVLGRTGAPFGSNAHARDEVRAQIAAYTLARRDGTGFDPEPFRDRWQAWAQALQEQKEKPQEINRLARDGLHMGDYLRSPQYRTGIIHDRKEEEPERSLLQRVKEMAQHHFAPNPGVKLSEEQIVSPPPKAPPVEKEKGSSKGRNKDQKDQALEMSR